MNINKHISKNYFYEILEKRLRSYEEAILGTRKIFGMQHAMMTSLLYNIQEIKKLDSENNFFGSNFWGYGINKICNGNEEYFHQDVEVIKKIPGLNKHGEDYRKLLLLIFKIENNALFVSTFCIDTCRYNVTSDINTKYDLKDFQNARMKTHENAIYVEFSFKDVKNPISFQIDTFHFPGDNLSGGQLAKYYIDKAKELANEALKNEKIATNPKDVDFINDFISGIKNLQDQDVKASCIADVKLNGRNHESPFRYFFQTWFTAKGYIAIPEPEKGNGRIDLKVLHNIIGDKIIEFKGWWNNDKDEIVNQVCSYLTEFEGDAFIFMINQTKGSIVEKYKEIITCNEMNYIQDSWQEISFRQTGFSYYSSKHKFVRIKTVYHFIFSVHL